MGGGRRGEGEGKKGGRGKRGKFCAREARAAPEGRRETRGREGGGRGERPTPLSTPFAIENCLFLIIHRQRLDVKVLSKSILCYNYAPLPLKIVNFFELV